MINIKYKVLKFTIFFLIIAIFFILNRPNDIILKDVIENEKNYNIKVTYPTMNNKLFKKIYLIIEKNINDFKSNLNNISNNYELNIETNIIDNGVNLYSIHIVIYKYIGGEYYNQEDLIYYFDYKKNKEVELKDIFIDLNNFENMTKNKLILEKTNYLYSSELLTKTLSNLNLRYVLFDKDNVTIFWPPTNSNFEIVTINFDYSEINNTINKKYQINPNKQYNNNKRMVRNVSNFKNKKLIALTFDDGPANKTTEMLLDGLKERNAKVTFFVLGNRAKIRPHIIFRAYNEGHTIGSHTYSHKNLLNLKEKNILYEINTTNEIITNIIGVKPKFIRPPYGNFNNKIIGMTNMTYILWNIDTLDWKTRNEKTIYNRIVKKAKDGQIVLLHDTYERSVKAALKAIDELQKEGFLFVSLEELEAMNIIDLNNKSYFYKIY